MLDPRQVDALYAAAAKQAKDGVVPMPEVDDATLAGAKAYFQGQTTCYDGQTVALQGGQEFAYVSDLTPVGGQDAVGYDPTISNAHSGVMLQVKPRQAAGGDRVVLDLQGAVLETTLGTGNIPSAQATSRPSGTEAVRMTTNPQGVIELPHVVNQSFATTVRVPLGRRVIVSGMTLTADNAAAAPRNLYLLVRVDAVK